MSGIPGRRHWKLLGVAAAIAAIVTGGGCSRSAEPALAEMAVERLTVDGSVRGRRFDGIGGVSAGGSSRLLIDYPEPERTQVLDYLFRPGYGASLQLLKVEIGGDVNGTVGSEASHRRSRTEVSCERGYEWWLVEEARKRNPQIRVAGLQWGAPGWLEGGFWSADNIDYLLSWLDCARERGLTIQYMGGWNESGVEPEWFVELGRALEETYPEVEIIAADHAHTSGWNVVPPMLTDSAFNAAVDIVGVHGPVGSRTDPEYLSVHTDVAARSLGKPLWASEYSSLAHDVGAVPLARALNRSYIDAGITGQMIWSPISAWYPTLPIADTGPIVAEWPWSGYYDVGKSVWSLAHTTQFTEPGWIYLDAGSQRLEAGATAVSLLSPDGEDFSIVIEAMDVEHPTLLEIRLQNLPDRELELWVTDLGSDAAADHFRKVGAVDRRDQGLQLRLEPRHLYTISTRRGAGRGDAEPGATPAEQLPLPFTADFDELQGGQLARFFSDVSGLFEAAPCGGGRSGMCYRQQVVRHPIEWHGPDMPPTTIVGDPRWWGDYRVRSDVLLEEEGYVELLGRVDGVQGDETVSGYRFQLSHTGEWRLYSEDMSADSVALAAGSTSIRSGRWHNLELRFEGERIRASIDDVQVADVRDDRHRVGQVGLRTGRWLGAQFDNLEVTPLGSWPDFIPQGEVTATATTAHEDNAYGYTYPASAAVDGRPETYWRSEWDPPAPLPQAITLDLGSVREVAALTYRPRISGHWAARYPGNPITRYVVAISSDGEHFAEVASGRWRRSEASTKVADFGGVRSARYVRLTAMPDGPACEVSVTAAEIRVSSTPLADPSPDTPSTPEDDGCPS